MSNLEIEPEIDRDGEVRHPSIHDAELLMIRRRKNAVFMEFELCSGDSIQVRFDEVEGMIFNNFREQNVVLDLVIDKGCSVSTLDLEKLFERPNIMPEKHDAYVKSTQEKFCWANSVLFS